MSYGEDGEKIPFCILFPEGYTGPKLPEGYFKPRQPRQSKSSKKQDPETKKKEELQTIEESVKPSDVSDDSENTKIAGKENYTEETKSDEPLIKETPPLKDNTQETKQQEVRFEDKEVNLSNQDNQEHKSIEGDSKNVENLEGNLTKKDNKERELAMLDKLEEDQILNNEQINTTISDEQTKQSQREVEQIGEEEKHIKEDIGLKDEVQKESEQDKVDSRVPVDQDVKKDEKGESQTDQKQENNICQSEQSDLEESLSSKTEKENFDTLSNTDILKQEDMPANLEKEQAEQQDNNKNETTSNAEIATEDISIVSQLKVEDTYVEQQAFEESTEAKEERKQNLESPIKTLDQESKNLKENNNTENFSAEIRSKSEENNEVKDENNPYVENSEAIKDTEISLAESKSMSEDSKHQEDLKTVLSQQELYENQNSQNLVIEPNETQFIESKSDEEKIESIVHKQTETKESNINEVNIPSMSKTEDACQTTQEQQEEANEKIDVKKSEAEIQQENKEAISDSFEEQLCQEEDKIKLIVESIDTTVKFTTESEINTKHNESKEQSTIDSTNETTTNIEHGFQKVTETKDDASEVGSRSTDITHEEDVTENQESGHLTTSTNEACSAVEDNITEQETSQTKHTLDDKVDSENELETWEVIDDKDLQDLKEDELKEKELKNTSEIIVEETFQTDNKDTLNISVGNQEENIKEASNNKSNINISELEIDLDNLITPESSSINVEGSEESPNMDSEVCSIVNEENKIELESIESKNSNLTSEGDSVDPTTYGQSQSESSKELTEESKFTEDTELTEISDDVVIESVKEVVVEDDQIKSEELTTYIESKDEDNMNPNLASADNKSATLAEKTTNNEILEIETKEKGASTSEEIDVSSGNQADLDENEVPPPLPVKTVQRRHNMGFFSRLAPVPAATESQTQLKQDEKSKEKSKSVSESPESKLKGVSKKESPLNKAKKSKESPLAKAKKISKGSPATKKSSISKAGTSKKLTKSESTESKGSELDTQSTTGSIDSVFVEELDKEEEELMTFVEEVNKHEIVVESSSNENKSTDAEAVKESVEAEAVMMTQQVEDCTILEPSLGTIKEISITEELPTESVQESVKEEIINNDISIFVTPPQVSDKPETPDSLVEELEIKLESTSEEVEKANVSDADSQTCESRLSWATHVEEVEALEAIETGKLSKENILEKEEISEEIVITSNDIIESFESINSKESTFSSEVTEVVEIIEIEVKKCEEFKSTKEENTGLQDDINIESKNNEEMPVEISIEESKTQVSHVDDSMDKPNDEVELKDSSNDEFRRGDYNREKEQEEVKTIDTKAIEDHFTDLIEEITEDVEKHQVFEDACSEFYNDEKNFKFEDCSSSGNLENNQNDETKDADTISVESFESCAETVIYLDENKEESLVVVEDIARPCSQTELIIIDDIRAQYEFEQSLIDSYLVDYTPEVIESIHIQFQSSLDVESKIEGENQMHENSGNLFILN